MSIASLSLACLVSGTVTHGTPTVTPTLFVKYNKIAVAAAPPLVVPSTRPKHAFGSRKALLGPATTTRVASLVIAGVSPKFAKEDEVNENGREYTHTHSSHGVRYTLHKNVVVRDPL